MLSGEDGLYFCLDSLQDNDNCTENITCYDTLCTASCKCWDGDMERVNDVPAFTGIDVEDQGCLCVLLY